MEPENGEAHKHDEPRTSQNPAETNTDGKKGKQKEKAEKVPYYRLFSFADSTDILLMIVGTVGAIGNGLGMPLMTLLLGQMIDSFGNNKFNTSNTLNQVSKVK